MLRVWDSSGRNKNLDQREFTDTSPLSRDSAFIVAAWSIRKGPMSLVGWSANTWT